MFVPDLAEYYNDTLEADSEDVLPKLPIVTHKFMYIIGLGIASLVLILSLVIHYFKEHLF